MSGVSGIGKGSIKNRHLGDGAADGRVIAANEVNNSHLANDAINGRVIAANGVANSHLANDAVDGRVIADNGVANSHLANNVVDGRVIGYRVIEGRNGASHISSRTIQDADMDVSIIDSALIKNRSIQYLDIDYDAVRPDELRIYSSSVTGAVPTSGDRQVNINLSDHSFFPLIYVDRIRASVVANTQSFAGYNGRFHIRNGTGDPQTYVVHYRYIA